MVGSQGATLPESVRFLATEIQYFVQQGHTHRLPQLLAYELTRWAGFQAGGGTPTASVIASMMSTVPASPAGCPHTDLEHGR